MNNSTVTLRVSKSSMALHLILVTMLGLTVGACAQGAGDDTNTAGLRNLLANSGSQSEASEPEAQQQEGLSLPLSQEVALPAAEEAPAAAPELAAVEAAPAVEANDEQATEEDSEAPSHSMPSRTGNQGDSVSTQSFTAGDPLCFDTLSEVAVTGLVASNTSGATSAYFGSPVVVQGDRMLVGAWADAGQAPEQGAAFVFERQAGNWVQTAKLTASDGEEELSGGWGASFGYTMDMDGDTLAIGAAWDDGDESEIDAGAVYVYELDGSEWVETKVRSPNQQENETFGDALAIAGDWLFVHGRDFTGEEDHEVVYTFHRTLNGFEYADTLVSPQGDLQRSFGESIAADGATLFVSAVRVPNADAGWSEREYTVIAYELSSNEWTMPQELHASDEAPDSSFGKLAFDGQTLVVGAPYANNSQGAAYIFEYQDGAWAEVASIHEDPSRESYFGWTVAVDGDSLAIGTALYDNSDAVYVYERSATTEEWALAQTVSAAPAATAAAADSFKTIALYAGELYMGFDAGSSNEEAVGALYAHTCSNQ
jgi:hypothetical protein